AETLKYFYLLFSPVDLLPLDSIVINTEAHIFPRFQLVRGLTTGWKRKPRDKEGKVIKTEKKALEGGGKQKEISEEQKTVKEEQKKKDEGTASKGVA
ncbi:MAG: hypothetical protein Q9198_002360, partial [Flavoplaca austrocitrina]